MDSPVAVITGASSGIGYEKSILLASKGYRVVLAARRVERLNEVAGKIRSLEGEVLVCQTDVTRESQVLSLVNRTVESFGRIDAIVNNAGRGQCPGGDIM